jgi:hypothetical protein
MSEVEITGSDSDISVDIQALQWVEMKIQVYDTAQKIYTQPEIIGDNNEAVIVLLDCNAMWTCR